MKLIVGRKFVYLTALYLNVFLILPNPHHVCKWAKHFTVVLNKLATKCIFCV